MGRFYGRNRDTADIATIRCWSALGRWDGTLVLPFKRIREREITSSRIQGNGPPVLLSQCPNVVPMRIVDEMVASQVRPMRP